MIFWREAWLRKVAGPAATLSVRPEQRQRLAARLQTKVSPSVYFCQASELLKATYPLTKWDRVRKSVADIAAGNIGVRRMVHNVAVWTFWRIRRRLLGEYARGQRQTSTPTDAPTGSSGTVTYSITPRSDFPIKNGFSVQFFVKAYRSGDPTLAGISGTRLVQVATHKP